MTEAVKFMAKYEDPIRCPICRKVFGEWKKIDGKVVIRKWCSRCQRFVDIEKESQGAVSRAR